MGMDYDLGGWINYYFYLLIIYVRMKMLNIIIILILITAIISICFYQNIQYSEFSDRKFQRR